MAAPAFTGAGPAPVALHPGTLVIVPPDHVHACNPAPDSAWSYQMLHLDPGSGAAISAERRWRAASLRNWRHWPA